MQNQKWLLDNYETLSLKKLEDLFYQKGYFLHLVMREKNKLLYEKVDKEKGGIHGYEVFKNRINLTRDHKGYLESYPKDEAFGKRAWFYRDFKSAIKKYEELN